MGMLEHGRTQRFPAMNRKKGMNVMKGTGFPYTVRMAYESEWEAAMSLAWKTFLEFEAQDYSEEGIRSFEDFIADPLLKRMFRLGAYQMFLAFHGSRVVGMITLRSRFHISLLFVDADYHRQGIGRLLMDRLCSYLRTEMGMHKVTVHASPYGLGFYRRLGFRELGEEMEADGIRYTPMEMPLV